MHNNRQTKKKPGTGMKGCRAASHSPWLCFDFDALPRARSRTAAKARAQIAGQQGGFKGLECRALESRVQGVRVQYLGFSGLGLRLRRCGA